MRSLRNDEGGIAPVLAGLAVLAVIVVVLGALAYCSASAMLLLLGALFVIGIIPVPSIKARAVGALACFAGAYALYAGVI